MYREDSLQFVQQRLSHHFFHLSPGLRRRPRVTRRLVAEMNQGEDRCFEHVDASVWVRCEKGSLWITHDGDPKDVILSASDSYRAEREGAMHVFALQPCLLEIEFEDEATATH